MLKEIEKLMVAIPTVAFIIVLCWMVVSAIVVGMWWVSALLEMIGL